jgi:hypothetical protein
MLRTGWHSRGPEWSHSIGGAQCFFLVESAA